MRSIPNVDTSEQAVANQTGKICPFLSAALGETRLCAKRGSTGFCTAISNSNGSYQNWLACPFRVLEAGFPILKEAVRRLYGVDPDTTVVLHPLVSLNDENLQDDIAAALADQAIRVFVFSQTSFGGEVDVPGTEASPAVKIDASVFELLADDGKGYQLGKSMIFEVQTADFHGSPLHAINLLKQAQNGHPDDYHDYIEANPEWTHKEVQGPNKSNIFKRIIYQTVYKMQVARDENCAGFVITIPEAVWDSWLVHLGKPEVVLAGDVYRLATPAVGDAADAVVEPDEAWIYVFDIDTASTASPRPLVIKKVIATTSAALLHCTFERAPKKALELQAMDRYRMSFTTRVKNARAGKLKAQKRLKSAGTLPDPTSQESTEE